MKEGCSTPFQKRNKLRVRIPITHRLATTRPCRIPDRHNHFAFSWPGCPAVSFGPVTPSCGMEATSKPSASKTPLEAKPRD